MLLFYTVVFCAVALSRAQVDQLIVVTDDELLNSLRTEDYLVSLFTRKDCRECDVLEEKLMAIREDLDDQLGAHIVKVYNSQLLRLYSAGKEPALVFFRHGIPLIYEGEPKPDDILHMFVDNKEPVVKELSDENFESLTQAASGATTGDWFVLFYSQDCVDCQHLVARWEAVGARLKTRLNVARINRKTYGKNTARRFSVTDSPTFRLGKMYRYTIPKFDTASFISFATDWYKNVPSSKVPSPRTPFDNLTQNIADYIQDNPWLWKLGSASVCIGIILSILRRLKSSEEQKQKEKEANVEKSKKSK